MKRAIVTGASGFVGSHLVRRLSADGVETLAVCRPGSETAVRIAQLPHVRLVWCGLDQLHTLPALQPDWRGGVWFHLAWDGASGPLRGQAEAQLRSVQGVYQAAEASKKMECDKLVATGTVYERLAENMRARAEFHPASLYLLSKCYARDLLAQIAKQQRLETVWCTFYQPIGWGIKPEQFTAYAIASLLEGKSPSFGPATALCDLMAVEDLVQGLLLAGDLPLQLQEYFIGSGEARPLREYLCVIQRLIAPDVPIHIGARPDDGLRFESAWLDTTPFSSETGYRPQVTLEESILRTRDWLKQPH